MKRPAARLKPVELRPDYARVIRDTRDASRDYWMPERQARARYLAGEFEMVQSYNGQWDYFDTSILINA